MDYKVWQIGVTKCHSSVDYKVWEDDDDGMMIAKCDKMDYKVRQGLQSVSG